MFQFTHPVWGATITDILAYLSTSVSIHAPRVGCDYVNYIKEFFGVVSIHAPRVGCDIVKITIVIDEQVSIHAPRVGCD